MARGVGGGSPANVAQYLSGIDFPCQKDDLIEHAEQNGAEDEVLEMLRNLPEGEYHTMADVMKGYGRAHGKGDGTEGGRGSRSSSRSQHARTSSRSDVDEEEETEDGRSSRGGSRT